MRHSMIVLAVLLAGSACAEDEAPTKPLPPNFTDAFPEMPMPPGGIVSAWSGSIDALQLTFRSAASAGEVATVYRTEFTKPGWTVVSDTEKPDSSVVLLAEKDNRSVWIRIERADSGSRIQMAGAVPGRDSIYQANRDAAADTTNRMVPRIVR